MKAVLPVDEARPSVSLLSAASVASRCSLSYQHITGLRGPSNPSRQQPLPYARALENVYSDGAKRGSADWERKMRQIDDVSAVISAPAALPPAAAPGLKMRPAWLQTPVWKRA